MSSIISKMNLEMERQLLQLFPNPVRFHLLFQASLHGFTSYTLKSKLDEVGQFIIIAYLEKDIARGAYLSKSRGQKFRKQFLFHLTSRQVTQIRSLSEDESSDDPLIYGDSFKLRQTSGRLYVDFSSDLVFYTGWTEESMEAKEVEMLRVADVGDVLLFPWREMSWVESAREELRRSFVGHQMASGSLSSGRVLLLGPAGSGKSSFVNSVRSVMYRRVLHLPIIGTAPGGFTRKLKSYDIRAERGGTSTSLTLCDVPPIGDSDSKGLSHSDILAIIKGHVSGGYKFRSDTPISTTDPCYRADPTVQDRVHCVAFCLSATEVLGSSEEQQETYRQLHATLSDLDIPQVILLTHVDQVCHAVSEDVRHAYTSRTVQERMQKAAELLGVSLSYVFPLKNYICELAVSCNTDILLLSALQKIQEAVDDMWEDLDDTPASGFSSPVPSAGLSDALTV